MFIFFVKSKYNYKLFYLLLSKIGSDITGLSMVVKAPLLSGR